MRNYSAPQVLGFSGAGAVDALTVGAQSVVVSVSVRGQEAVAARRRISPAAEPPRWRVPAGSRELDWAKDQFVKLNPDIKVFAVEPAASPILNGGTAAGHPIQGIGANFIPEILDTNVYDEVLDAPTEEAVKWARRAGAEEGILAGISSGAALWGANQIASRPEFAGKKIVVIIPSFGERYLSTILYKDLMDLDN